VIARAEIRAVLAAAAAGVVVVVLAVDPGLFYSPPGCVAVAVVEVGTASWLIRRGRRASRQAARDAREDSRWLGTPAGCCECGTGGPYYRGSDPQVTRYLYSGATAGGGGRVDWSACSAHPCPEVAPLVDYGTDVVVTFRQTESDAVAALAAYDAAALDGGAEHRHVLGDLIDDTHAAAAAAMAAALDAGDHGTPEVTL
jgi:hypothetical protein